MLLLSALDLRPFRLPALPPEHNRRFKGTLVLGRLYEPLLPLRACVGVSADLIRSQHFHNISVKTCPQDLVAQIATISGQEKRGGVGKRLILIAIVK